jgi:hypothetical protein
MSKEVSRVVEELDPGKPVFAPSHQWTAYLRFQHVCAEQIRGVRRDSHFTQKPFPWDEQSNIYAFFEGIPPPEAFPDFEFSGVVHEFSLVTRGQELARFNLIRYVHKH